MVHCDADELALRVSAPGVCSGIDLSGERKMVCSMAELHRATSPEAGKGAGFSVRRALTEYVIAAAAVGLAFLVRLELDRFWGDSLPYVTFYLAFLVVAWFTGVGPTLAGLVVSLLLGDFFFTSPRYTLGFTSTGEWLSAVLYTSVCLGLMVFARRMRRNEEDLRASQDRLELTVSELHRAHGRTQLLAETASQLLLSSEPQHVVNALCAKVMAFLDCDAFFNFLVDESAGNLRLNACGGIPKDQAGSVSTLEFGAAVCGCAARDGCRIVAEDIFHRPDPRTQLVKSLGIQAYACHPLKVQERVLGTLSFGTRSRTSFSEEELSLMKAVADLVAIAMERQRSQAELRHMNLELEERVKERTRSLEEMTEQMNAFCYSVAHDLRSPLRTQISFAEVLLEEYGEQLGAEGRKYAGLVLQAAQRQSDLIADLMAHINVSRADMPLQPVSLPEAIAKARADLTLETQQKDACIDVSELNGACVAANPSSLHLVILNLLTNACKFVPPGTKPHVRLWTSNQDGFVRLWVQDNGIGIDPSDSPKLFGMFQRFHRQDKYPGTGMGLAIVKKAVERMGGHVGAESELGKGSRFWVDLHEANN